MFNTTLKKYFSYIFVVNLIAIFVGAGGGGEPRGNTVNHGLKFLKFTNRWQFNR
jgi:hypothetical protein